jgi:hypothetical protein
MLNESFGIERDSTPGTRKGPARAEEAEDVVEETTAEAGEADSGSEPGSERKENA